MVLNVGLVSACIIYKNRAGAQTRLQKLQRKLKQKPISQKTLYSYPIKKIFSIVMIICFMLGLVVFLREFQAELKIMHKGIVEEVAENEHDQTHFLFPYRPVNLIGDLIKTLENNLTNPALIKSISDEHRYIRIKKTIYWLLVFFTIPLLILIGSLEFERVIVKPKFLTEPNHFSGRISKQKLSLLSGWTDNSQLLCQIDDNLIIELCGQSRFSNTNFYYAIKKISNSLTQKKKHTQTKYKQQINSPSSVNNPQFPEFHQQVIMQKGNIYEARQALIYLCHVLQKDVNLNIKNGPVQEKKEKVKKYPIKDKKHQ